MMNWSKNVLLTLSHTIPYKCICYTVWFAKPWWQCIDIWKNESIIRSQICLNLTYHRNYCDGRTGRNRIANVRQLSWCRRRSHKDRFGPPGRVRAAGTAIFWAVLAWFMRLLAGSNLCWNGSDCELNCMNQIDTTTGRDVEWTTHWLRNDEWFSSDPTVLVADWI